MDEDVRLNAQLKSLGKKLFQFRDLVAKMDIPESLPDAPYDQLFWDTFVKKCSTAVTVLKQVHSALTPDMYHLSVYPGEKIWRNPAAVPDLLSVPDRKEPSTEGALAHSAAEVQAWNAQLEQTNTLLEEFLSNQRISFQSQQKGSCASPDHGIDERVMISRLLTQTSRQRADASGLNSEAFGFRYAHENPFSYEFSCGVCSRASSEEDLDSMILCEGGCKRIFHMDCVGLSALPDGASSKWACSRCVSRLRTCAICDGVERAKGSTCMVRCSISHCGKWFHTTCIETRYGGMREGGVCPRHTCVADSCTSPITDECYFCILCLNAYHLRCMPEEVEVICENTCLCLNHQFALPAATGNRFEDRLLSVQIGRKVAAAKSKKSSAENSEQVSIASTASTPDCSSVIPGESAETVSALPKSLLETDVHRFLAQNFLAPYKVITNVSDEHIVLSDDDELVATTKPKESAVDTSGLNFVRLRANEWLCPRPRRGKEEEDFAGVCACTSGACDHDCTNRVCMVQCEYSNCRPTNELKKKGGNDFKTFQCGNKPFFKGNGTANSGKYKIVSAGGKGMGVMAKTDIKAGEFIIEYIGEVLTVDDWADRQKLEPPGSCKHFYVMELDSDHLVDASRKGNDSRLINHSCDPNLETQKWTVNGESRIGLFAICDIPKGQEMTFNYQFETFASKPFKCLCGTSKCSGWIGGKAKKSTEAKEKEQGKRDRDILLPLPMLQNVSAVDIPISATRSDGTRKRDEEISLEEISACKDRIDYYLQHIWSGRSSGEEWASAGRACYTLYPTLTGQPFNPAAVFALSITKIEANFIKERNLLLLRQLNKARRDLARRFYVWPETVPAIERVLEGNWISDDICVRCRRTGNLVWCKTCVRSFHQCCVSYGDKLTSDPLTGEHAFTCRRCRRLAGAGIQPPIRLAKKLRVDLWKERRKGYWAEVVLPSLYTEAKKRKGN